jgi:hypothetical protein
MLLWVALSFTIVICLVGFSLTHSLATAVSASVGSTLTDAPEDTRPPIISTSNYPQQTQPPGVPLLDYPYTKSVATRA